MHFGTPSRCKFRRRPPAGQRFTGGVQEGRNWVTKQVKTEPLKPTMRCCPLTPRPLLVVHFGNWPPAAVLLHFVFFLSSSHFLKLLTNDFHSYRPERDVPADPLSLFRFGCVRKCPFKLQTQREKFSSGGRERRTSEETFHSDSIRTRRSPLGLKYPFDTSWRLNNTRLEPNNEVLAACRDQRP